jgi:hypothetical protein
LIAPIIAFLMSSAGRYVVIFAIGGAVLFGARQSGVNSQRRKCEAAAQQRIIEIQRRDVQIGELQAKLDARITAELNKGQELENDFQRKLEAELANRPVGAQCRAGPDDIKRLR